MKKYSSVVILIGIFALALFLRLILLSIIPNGLQQDELNAGYQGYKLIKTGSDLYGNILPYYINRFGDYRPAGIFYLTGIFTAFFGLTTFMIRFPSALFGALTIFPTYFLTKQLSQSRLISLIAALFLAISPWHIVVSRATSEQVVALFFIILGIIFVIKGIHTERKQEYIFAGIAFLISYFFYHTPRVFIPVVLFLLSFSATYFPSVLSLKKRIPFTSFLWGLTFCMFLVTLGLSFTKAGVGRLSQTSVWGDPSVQAKIKTLSDTEKGNILAARIFDNKAIIYGRTIFNQYLAYFSPEFLYVAGGLPARYVVPEMGLFYYIELPLLLIGAYFVIKRKDVLFALPFVWLAVGPLAASVTTEDIPNVQRALFMLPAFQVIEAYGLYYGIQIFNKKWRFVVGTIIGLLLLANGIYFWHMYVVVSPSHISYVRDDGNQALFGYLQQVEGNYTDIYIPSFQDLPLYFYYFSGSKSPTLSYTQQDVDKGFSLGKFHFVPDECPERIIPQKILQHKKVVIVDFANCSQQNSTFQQIQTIVRQDDTTAYVIKKEIQ